MSEYIITYQTMTKKQDKQINDLEFKVIARFCLYGFLKNQRYFEPFILLAFVEKGLSFFQIGLLFGFRALTVNIFEIPSGAAADLYGRIRTLIFSFIAYTISFIVFAISDHLWHLFAAMFLFGIGEAFRTGTHKAIIFDYLKSKNKQDQKVRIYGLTRSFSQMGSAMSALFSALLVFWRGNYSDIFWLCAIPSSLNIINFMGYPKYLDTKSDQRMSPVEVYRYIYKAFCDIWSDRKQRRLIGESCGFEGVIKVVKDYNQIIIKNAALALPFLTAMTDEKRTAILIGSVYTVLYVLTSMSAHQSWRISKLCGADDNAARVLWFLASCLYGIMTLGLILNLTFVTILTFIILLMMLNIWKPVLVSRVNTYCPGERAATTLSIESQSKSFVAMVLAPAIGLAIDSIGMPSFAVFGLVVSVLFFVTSNKK